MSDTRFDTTYTDRPICPHCERPYRVECSVTITYSTCVVAP